MKSPVDGYQTYLVAVFLMAFGVWLMKQGQAEAGVFVLSVGMATFTQRRATAKVEKRVEEIDE